MIERVQWQTGTSLGMAVYSRQHLWPEGAGRALCGARGNWMIGNFGHTNTGPCQRCFAIAERRGLDLGDGD